MSLRAGLFAGLISLSHCGLTPLSRIGPSCMDCFNKIRLCAWDWLNGEDQG